MSLLGLNAPGSSLAETIDERGRVTGREFALVDARAQRDYAAYAAPVVTPAYMGKRTIFARLPYRPEFPFAADFDFLARAAEIAPAGGVPEVLLHYRRYAEQTTETRAAAIEADRCAVRTVTARRRAGRDEALAEVQTNAELAPHESCREAAKQNLAEQLHVLAAYHARRAIALRHPRRLDAVAIRTGLAAIRGARGGERTLAARMFFTGPVRALGLRSM